MKKKKTSRNTCLAMSVFLLAVAICTSSVFATGTYDGGDGSQGNPFQINTPAQMDEIGQHSEDWGSYFILTADIDLSGFTGTQFNIIGTKYSTSFTGVFDGNSHTISNFTYTSTGKDYIALFGKVGVGGEIKDLGLTNVNVDAGTGWYVGGLVGVNQGKVSNCYAIGAVTGVDYVGGLVGNSSGTVSNCYATTSVSGYARVGGLVGQNYGGTVSNCYTTGNVGVNASGSHVGGLVGSNYATVSNCYATGNVGGEYRVGGLVGSNYGTVSNCYASGSVTGYEDVGGLVGWNYYGTVSNCYAAGSNCYAAGSVTGNWNVGGLVGDNVHGTVSSCYATANVSGYEDVGGLVGRNLDADIFFASFWDTQTSGQAYGVGYKMGSGTVEVYGRTTAQMQTESTFTDYYGWDFTTPIWTIDEGNDYPRLWWEWENSIPVADAGDDQTVYSWIDGMAEVKLDGSDSNDVDGDDLTYLWTWTIDANEMTATGVDPNVLLPVGVHEIELVVNDGTADSEPDYVTITVVEALEVAMKFTPQALNPGSQGKWVKAHFVLPEGFAVEDVDADTPAEIEQLGIESDHMNVFINEDGLVEIEAAFRRGDFCAAIDYGPGEVTVAGRLTSGQYFCGSDTIKIITNNLGYVGALASYWLEADCGPPDWCGGLDVDQDSIVDWLDFAMSDGCCIELIKE